MDPNLKLYVDQGELLSNPERYRRLIGKFKYLTITRLDISFAVSVVNQYMAASRLPYWEAVLQIVRYLKAYQGRGLLGKANGHLWVEAFVDSDWAGSPLNKRSTTGYYTFLGSNLIT